MDGVDPTDLSPNGRATFLCYIKRQQLRFIENVAVISASADKDKDVSNAVNQLKKLILPQDPGQTMRHMAKKQAEMARDTAKVWKKVVKSDGSVALKLVRRDGTN